MIMSYEHQICTRCVMDTTDSMITFDELGVCDHCNTFDQKIAPKWRNDSSNESDLLRLVKKIKKSGRKKEFELLE